MAKAKTLLGKLKDEREALQDRLQELDEAIERAKQNKEKHFEWFSAKLAEYDQVIDLIEANQNDESIPF